MSPKDMAKLLQQKLTADELFNLYVILNESYNFDFDDSLFEYVSKTHPHEFVNPNTNNKEEVKL